MQEISSFLNFNNSKQEAFLYFSTYCFDSIIIDLFLLVIFSTNKRFLHISFTTPHPQIHRVFHPLHLHHPSQSPSKRENPSASNPHDKIHPSIPGNHSRWCRLTGLAFTLLPPAQTATSALHPGTSRGPPHSIIQIFG